MALHRARPARSGGVVGWLRGSARRTRQAVGLLCGAAAGLLLVSLIAGTPLRGMSNPWSTPHTQAPHSPDASLTPEPVAAASRTAQRRAALPGQGVATTPASTRSLVVAAGRSDAAPVSRAPSGTGTPRPTTQAPAGSDSPPPPTPVAAETTRPGNGRTHANTTHPRPTKTRHH
jgi:hypothetical protein